MRAVEFTHQKLYHASLAHNIDSFKSKGIIPGGAGDSLFNWCDKAFVYLTDDPHLAMSFISSGSIEPEDDEDEERIYRLLAEGGVLLTVNQDMLDEELLHDDPQWSAEGSKCYAYQGIVPPQAIVGYKEFETD
jgi:hypothetical protein